MEKSETQYTEKQLIGKCMICDSNNDTQKYSFSGAVERSSNIELCVEHKRLFEILGQPDSPNPARSINGETQQTKKVTTRIPKSLVEAADTAAETQGQTRSELVRDALQVYIELQDVNSAADDLLIQAAKQGERETQTDRLREDIEFLKQRIRKLESLLEDSIEKYNFIKSLRQISRSESATSYQ